MSRPEFGVSRLPAGEAEDAPAWPPLKSLAVPKVRVDQRSADEGVSQIEFGDGVWHRYGHIAKAGYYARCGAMGPIPEVHSRVVGTPTCPNPLCAP